jgi:hypothetical protein
MSTVSASTTRKTFIQLLCVVRILMQVVSAVEHICLEETREDHNCNSSQAGFPFTGVMPASRLL